PVRFRCRFLCRAARASGSRAAQRCWRGFHRGLFPERQFPLGPIALFRPSTTVVARRGADAQTVRFAVAVRPPPRPAGRRPAAAHAGGIDPRRCRDAALLIELSEALREKKSPARSRAFFRQATRASLLLRVDPILDVLACLVLGDAIALLDLAFQLLAL